MEILLALILSWLVNGTDLPASDVRPLVRFASSSEMAVLRHRRAVAARSDQVAYEPEPPAPTSHLRNVYAMYDEVSRTIYLPKTWSPDSPADVSMLVHEMVHFLQHIGGLEYDCPEQREKDAYQAQERWLNHFGSSLQEEFEFDAMTLLLRTRCMH